MVKVATIKHFIGADQNLARKNLSILLNAAAEVI